MIVHYSEVESGMKLERNVYDKCGLLLLVKGTVLTDLYVSRLNLNKDKLFHSYLFVEDECAHDLVSVDVSL